MEPQKIEEVKTLAKENPTAEGVFRSLADRKRHTKRVDLERYKKALLHMGIGVVDNDYKATWNRLEKLGLGTITKDRKGNYKFFEWHYSLKNISAVAINKEPIKDNPRNRQASKKFDRSAHMKAFWKKRRGSNTKQVVSSPTQEATRFLYIPVQNEIVTVSIPTSLKNNEYRVIKKALSKYLSKN